MNDLQRIAAWLRNAQSAVAFTGAGISTESGIPDFRSPGGIWSQSQPVYFDDFVASESARYEYWRQKSAAHRDFHGSQPNKGHQILARWQRTGLLRTIITQNIDGLHQDAGSENVIELHGTARYIACLECQFRGEADPLVQAFLASEEIPACPECGGLLKHATISFGQMLDPATIEQATRQSQRSDLFLAMGSSLVVHPAAGLPPLAAGNGARLVIINREATEQDELAEIVIHAGIGDTLAAIDQALSDTESFETP